MAPSQPPSNEAVPGLFIRENSCKWELRNTSALLDVINCSSGIIILTRMSEKLVYYIRMFATFKDSTKLDLNLMSDFLLREQIYDAPLRPRRGFEQYQM